VSIVEDSLRFYEIFSHENLLKESSNELGINYIKA